ncbi:MAG: signal peptidase II [Clostridiales bacterium]|nr:signal peptidase II [Clostridiales bacterium]
MVYAIATVLVLILDQAVKFWTTKNILLDAIGDECATLIPGVIHLTNVHNYGAAFSILENARWLLVLVSLIFVIAIIVLISMEIIHTPFAKWTAVLVMAGALGNCIDRVLYGYVVDMFELEFMNFAVFNVADMFITVCGILFCIHVIVYKEPEAVRNANESPAARRRRGEQEAKEQPYSRIPHRGEHRSLEDDLRLNDPEDPFSEWGFGDVVDDTPRTPTKGEEKKPAPPRHAKAPAGEQPRRSTRQPEEPTRSGHRTAKAPEEQPERPRRRTKAGEEALEEPRSHVRAVKPEDAADRDASASAKRSSAAGSPEPAQPAGKRARAVEAPDYGDIDDILSSTGEDEEETYSVEDILSEFRDL